ncbi:hypothetical protein JZO79_11895 [Vagococcus fluvialis]|uniref:hypothetical protein n=1 Tax=Vagococcus fluvialis TaxID=2738 RepID=UPI001A8EC007|nr:hypothetical protein [Vagococcus fluvialis]MBO0444316.1 hypothetical protein [Vagococcus fluvialis]
MFKLKKTRRNVNKKKATSIVFVGTRNELISYLKNNNFWDNDRQYQEYIENKFLLINEKGNHFGEFTIDFFSKEIKQNGTGYVYSIDNVGNAPTYPQKVNICINAEGFNQHEINKAISALSNEMQKNRVIEKEGFKDFFITKD